LERMRDDLLHMLVHDMRNPLAVIFSAFQMLEDPALNDAKTEILDIAKSNNERVLSLVNDILEIGRLEARRVMLQEEPVLLDNLVKRLVKAVVLPHSSSKLILDFPANLPILWIDQRLVERVFHNLLDNAVKFIPEEDGRIVISAVQDGSWVETTIYNNGPHISPMLMKRLFQKFTAGEYNKRGYGMGLAFCRLVVEAHEGRIWASNEFEGGVSFTFTLPIAPDFESDEGF